MTEKPSDQLIALLNQTVIDMMDRHRADMTALKEEVDVLKQDQRDMERDAEALRSALSRALDPHAFREPVPVKKQRAREQLREIMRAEGDTQHPPSPSSPNDPRPR